MNRTKKLIINVILIYVILQIRLRMPKTNKDSTGLPHIPLLNQEVNKNFNRDKVWVSMSFCYSAEATVAENKAAVAKAVLASNLWKELSEVNVVVQVYNNTDIAVDDYEKLEKMIQKRGMTDYPMA